MDFGAAGRWSPSIPRAHLFWGTPPRWTSTARWGSPPRRRRRVSSAAAAGRTSAAAGRPADAPGPGRTRVTAARIHWRWWRGGSGGEESAPPSRRRPKKKCFPATVTSLKLGNDDRNHLRWTRRVKPPRRHEQPSRGMLNKVRQKSAPSVHVQPLRLSHLSAVRRVMWRSNAVIRRGASGCNYQNKSSWQARSRFVIKTRITCLNK